MKRLLLSATVLLCIFSGSLFAGINAPMINVASDLMLADGNKQSAKNNIQKLDAKIFPVPASNTLNLNWNLTMVSNVQIIISDDNRNVVFSTTISSKVGKNQFQVDVSKFEAGIYLVRIVSESATYNQKITIVRN